MKVAEYAATRGVSRNTVYRWVEQKIVVLDGKTVNVAESDRRVRDAGLGKPKAPDQTTEICHTPPGERDKAVRVTKQRDKSSSVTNPPEESAGNPITADTAAASAPILGTAPASEEVDPEKLVETADAFIQRVLRGEYETTIEAERIKQNALALKHVLDVHERAGRLVNKVLVEREVFDAVRSWRDTWMNWSSKIAPLLAADLGIEPDKLSGLLAGYVHKQLLELGEIELDLTDEAT